MSEFFDPLPNGPVRMGRSFLERMQRAVEQSSRFPNPLPFVGAGGSDASGAWIDFHPEELVFATITVQPTGGYPGYSWLEEQPDIDGGWATPETQRYGDNGSRAGSLVATIADAAVVGGVATVRTVDPHGFLDTDTVMIDGAGDPFDGTGRITATPADDTFTFDVDSIDVPPTGAGGTATVAGRPAFQPAFDLNGSSTIAAGTKVVLLRGYKHVGSTDAANTPDTLGPGYIPGQEYRILSGGGGDAIAARRFRIAGRPYSVGGILFYPAYARQRQPTSAIADIPESSPKLVYVQSEYEQPLGTTGNFVVWARREGTVSIPNDPVDDPMGPATAYECWVTRDHICMVDVYCGPDGEIVPIRDGKFEEEDETPSLDFSREGNSQYVGMFG